MGVIEDIRKPLVQPPTDGVRIEDGVRLFDLEELCPIDLVRTHTKTDDVPFVTDDQLRLYRKAAYEGAQHYSAILCGPIQNVIETIKHKRPFPSMSRPHLHMKHTTRFPVLPPYVYVYAGVARQNKPIAVDGGERIIKLITHSPDMFFDECCANPCGDGSQMMTQKIMYSAGYKCPQDVPSGIVLGMLRFIAWSIMRPGDELLTQRNRTSIAEGGVTGTNNAAWASGALEMWAQYDDLRY